MKFQDEYDKIKLQHLMKGSSLKPEPILVLSWEDILSTAVEENISLSSNDISELMHKIKHRLSNNDLLMETFWSVIKETIVSHVEGNI